MANENYYDSLSDMGRIKESLMSLFCDTEDITHLIMPEKDDDNFSWEQNWYGGTFDKNIYGDTETKTLSGHCFDIPYTEGAVSDGKCALFIETHLIKAPNQRIKNVGVDVYIVCHKDFIRLSEEDTQYYNSIGIYGNRVDCAVQAINSAINDSTAMNAVRKKYSIGDLIFTDENPVSRFMPDGAYCGKCLSYSYHAFYQRKNNVKQVTV